MLVPRPILILDARVVDKVKIAITAIAMNPDLFTYRAYFDGSNNLSDEQSIKLKLALIDVGSGLRNLL
jgi:hypothetical protein